MIFVTIGLKHIKTHQNTSVSDTRSVVYTPKVNKPNKQQCYVVPVNTIIIHVQDYTKIIRDKRKMLKTSRTFQELNYLT